MPRGFDDGGQGEFLAQQMNQGAFSEEAARKLVFELENQLRVAKHDAEYRKERGEKYRLRAQSAEQEAAAHVEEIADLQRLHIQHLQTIAALRAEAERLREELGSAPKSERYHKETWR